MTNLVKDCVIFKRSVDIFIFLQDLDIKSCAVVMKIRKRLIDDVIPIEKVGH